MDFLLTISPFISAVLLAALFVVRVISEFRAARFDKAWYRYFSDEIMFRPRNLRVNLHDLAETKYNPELGVIPNVVSSEALAELCNAEDLFAALQAKLKKDGDK